MSTNKFPCYLFREFLWRLGNIRRCRGVKSGDWGLKIQNFPVNSLLLYAIDRRIVYLRQEYYASRGNPTGCSFLPRNPGFFISNGTSVCSIFAPLLPKCHRKHTLPKIPMPVYIAFYRNLWYNNQQEQGQHFVAVFYCPATCGAFL